MTLEFILSAMTVGISAGAATLIALRILHPELHLPGSACLMVVITLLREREMNARRCKTEVFRWSRVLAQFHSQVSPREKHLVVLHGALGQVAATSKRSQDLFCFRSMEIGTVRRFGVPILGQSSALRLIWTRELNSGAPRRP